MDYLRLFFESRLCDNDYFVGVFILFTSGVDLLSIE